MKNFLKKALGGIGLAFLVMALAQPALASIPEAKATGGAALNADPRDFAVLAVSNYTRCPGSSSCWGPSVTNVQPGDVLSFVLYAHNTGAEPAYNTRVSMSLNAQGSQMRGRGVITADNAPAVYDDVNISFAQSVTTPVQLTFVGGEYYANSTLDPNNPDPFPNGASASQVAQGGINIGTLQNDYAGQFTKDVQIVVRYRVGGSTTCSQSPTLTVTPSTQSVRVGEVAQYRAIYDSNGSCAGGETDVTNSASWSVQDFAAVAESLGQGRFRGIRQGTDIVRASYNGLSDTATINVTGVTSCDSNATLVIVPSSATFDVGSTYQYRALYDADGPDCSGGEIDVTNSASWSSDNTSIATSQGSGRIRGQRDGSATIRARYNGLTATATARVRDNGNGGGCDSDETLVIVPYQASFSVGQTYQYRALYDADGPGCSGAERDVTDSATWSVSNSNIASSQGSGRVRGVNGGTATVTARYSGLSATAYATVVATGGPTPPPVIVQPPVVLPPTIIGGGTVIQQPTVGTITSGVTQESVACITVTPSVDVTSMLPGQDFVYTTLYRNDCPFALNNAVLRVFIPNDAEFKASSNPFFIREGQKFSYNIGTLPPGGQGSVAVSGFVRKDARIGDTETFTSSIEFLDGTGRIQGTTSYLVAVLGGDIRRTLAASLSDTLGHIFGSAWLWILITILILAGIVWFIISMIMRRRAQSAATSKVVVAPAEDPLRALRNA